MERKEYVTVLKTTPAKDVNIVSKSMSDRDYMKVIASTLKFDIFF